MDVLRQYVLDMAAQREVDARALAEEYSRSAAPGRDVHTDARFGLELLAAALGRSENAAPVETLVRHHTHCGGGDTYRPGPEVRAVLEAVTAQAQGAGDDLRMWVQAAMGEMGEDPEHEEAS